MSDVRDEKGRFTPGNVANPGGRTRMPEALRMKLKDGADKAVQVWQEILTNPEEKTSDRIKAGELLTAYAYGKPIQQVDVEGSVNTNVVDTSSLDAKSKEAIVNLVAASMGEAGDA